MALQFDDPAEVLLTYIYNKGYPYEAELSKVMALRDRDRGEAALLRRIVVPAAKQYKLERGSMTDRWDQLFPKKAQREVAAALYEEGLRLRDLDRGGLRNNSRMARNHHHSVPGGLSSDHELLSQLIEMAAESLDYGRIRVDAVPPEVLRVAVEYDTELAAALDEVVRLYPPQGDADADDLWDASAPYLVLMTLRGEGVGIWDGSWDQFYSDREIKRVQALLQRRLQRFADRTGGGALEEAFMNAASEIAGDPDYTPNARHRPNARWDAAHGKWIDDSFAPTTFWLEYRDGKMGRENPASFRSYSRAVTAAKRMAKDRHVTVDVYEEVGSTGHYLVAAVYPDGEVSKV